jgi:hypothetical protein
MGRSANTAAIVALISLIVGVSQVHPAHAGEGIVRVSLAPPTAMIEPGETCTLQVLVDAVDSLSCMECAIAFDSSLATLVSAQEGTLYEAAPFPSFFIWELTAPDSALAVNCVLGYRSYILPPGEIARFILEGVAPGTCPVRITSTRLWDIDRVEMGVIVDPSAWIFIGTPAAAGDVARGRGSLRSYPNPFHASTSIVLSLPPDYAASDNAKVSVTIYSPSGRKIRSLYKGTMSFREARFEWDGRDQAGRRVASGVYFSVVQTRGMTLKAKLVLIQ